MGEQKETYLCSRVFARSICVAKRTKQSRNFFSISVSPVITTGFSPEGISATH